VPSALIFALTEKLRRGSLESAPWPLTMPLVAAMAGTELMSAMTRLAAPREIRIG